MPGRTRILIFTGDGKGKTTAALGMALRAVGHGMRVRIIQFIKADASTGEISAIADLPGVEISQLGLGFVPPKNSPKFEEHKRAAEEGLDVAREALASGEYDLVILDEVCGAVGLGLLDEGDVVDAIEGSGISAADDEDSFGISAALKSRNTANNAPEGFGKGVSRNNGMIIVLTGRGATQKLIDMADIVTEMKLIKHGMDSGWKAQAGIEY